MTLGTLILLGLVVGEVIAIVKINRQSERIDKLQKQLAEQKKKSS
jgi:hypothetical protein